MAVDLILGVMQAADASKTQRAHARLSQLNTDKPGLFDKIMTAVAKRPEKPLPAGEDLIAQVLAAADPAKVQAAEARLNGIGAANTAVAANDPKREVMKKLEGSLLTSLVDEVMPKDSESLYGEGTAGEVARQFQVENLAEAAAEAEPLGLARQLYGNAPQQAPEPLMKDQQWPYFVRRTITPYAA